MHDFNNPLYTLLCFLNFLNELTVFLSFLCMGGAGGSDPYSLRWEHWQGVLLCVHNPVLVRQDAPEKV